MNILFLCVANSARSQIAEGLAKKMLINRARVESAGSTPGTSVHPLAIQTLQEVGINFAHQKPKSISELLPEFVKNLDLVITLCKEEQCPVLHGKFRKESWSLPDPADPMIPVTKRIEAFRETRDAIKEKIEILLAKIGD